MIFVATGANASENNLGKISIKNIGDVSQNTYDVIVDCGNKSFTDDEIIAIDDFLIILNGYIEKIDSAIIPILGIQENMVIGTYDKNKLKGTYDLKIKDYRGLKQTEKGSGLTLKMGINGITSTGISAIGNERGVLANSGLYLSNYSVIFTGIISDSRKLSVQPVTVGTISETAVGISSINAVSGSITMAIEPPSDKVLAVSWSVDVPSHDIKVYTAHNKQYTHDNDSITVDEPYYTKSVGRETRIGYGSSYLNQAMSVYIYAKALTESELKTLSDACYDLVKKLAK